MNTLIDRIGNRVNYIRLLQRPEWKKFRLRVLQKDNNQCICCGSTKRLQAHHKQYHFSKTLNSHIKPWLYDLKYLATFCKTCHKRGHNRFKISTKIIE